jgi:TolB-like protein/Tfp pilus assembly protein PilF
MAVAPGARLGPYEILTLIGKGGMGEVWRARDPRLGRDVAIKVADARFSERFEREAKAIAALNHPNICQIYDVGPDFLVMEYIEGSRPRGPVPQDDAVRLAGGIAAALEAAHARGIIHRDLKPDNVLVTAAGVKLLDFGLALFDEPIAVGFSDTVAVVSVPGAVVGTVAYMSPEQVQGLPADTRSDIFAFGLLVYELLTGRQPFAGGSAADTMAAILRDDPPPLRTPSGDAPAWLTSIVMRCLHKAPAARFQTMSEVRAALDATSVCVEDPPPAVVVPSIAVLPFANISGDKDNEYFSDGLAEEILNLLAKIPGLRVIARTSSFAFRGKEQDITGIARALRVGTILEGSVRRAGSRIRVTAQLIEAANGSHLWSERYDRDMTDVFAIQDEIGAAIAGALRVRLAPRTRVKNLDAWEHWLKGVHYRGRNTPDNVAKAKDHFEQAAQIDPAYAQAYSGLAFCYFILAAQNVFPVGEMTTLAVQAANQALALDPADSEAHTILAMMAGIFNYDWQAADAHYRRALACEQISPRVHYCFAMYGLLTAERFHEAVEHARLALQSDPMSMLFHSGVIYCLSLAGRTEDALRQARQALEIEPHSHLALQALGFLQLRSGDARDAIDTFRRVAELAPWTRIGAGAMAAAGCLAGDDIAGRQAGRQLGDADRLGFGGAMYFAAAGDAEHMFQALDACYDRRELFLTHIRLMPLFDPYRADPRWGALLARLNLR